MDYLSALLIDPTRPSEEAQLGPVWSNQHPLLAKWALVLPALTVPQRKAVLTCMRVQQPIVSNPRLQKLIMEQFPQDATFDVPESVITPGLSEARMDYLVAERTREINRHRNVIRNLASSNSF